MTVSLEDGDRIAGYRVVRSHDAHDAEGRVVLVERPQYVMRWIVAFHPRDARGWVAGVLHADWVDALATFEVLAGHYSSHRGCKCHAS